MARASDGPDCPHCGSARYRPVYHEITGEYMHAWECGACGYEVEFDPRTNRKINEVVPGREQEDR